MKTLLFHKAHGKPCTSMPMVVLDDACGAERDELVEALAAASPVWPIRDGDLVLAVEVAADTNIDQLTPYVYPVQMPPTVTLGAEEDV